MFEIFIFTVFHIRGSSIFHLPISSTSEFNANKYKVGKNVLMARALLVYTLQIQSAITQIRSVSNTYYYTLTQTINQVTLLSLLNQQSVNPPSC